MKAALFWLLFLVHLALGLFYREIVGIRIEMIPGMNTWDSAWQTLPVDTLRSNAVQSIWYLHAQPPVYNWYGAGLINAFFPNHLPFFQYANMILGAVLSGLVFLILLQMTRKIWLSFAAGLLLALNPALFLYEGFILYDLLTAFLVVFSVWLVGMYQSRKRLAYALGFILTLNILILTRSMYHLVLLVPATTLLCILAAHRWRSVLLACVLISLLSFGWYARNYALFGFFGSSSWYGLSFWNVAAVEWSPARLQMLVDRNVIDPAVVELPAFSRPSAYAKYGFDATSPINVLARDDYNNINVPAISYTYQKNALRLVASDPVRYLRNVLISYTIFSRPSTRYRDFETNVAKMGLHEYVSSQVIQGEGLMRQLTHRDMTFLFFVLPLTMLAYGLLLTRTCGASRRRWLDYVRAEPTMLFSAMIILYVTVGSSLLELGENERFKFTIEQLFAAFMVNVAYQWFGQIISRRERSVATSGV